jgi:hypothetical protein
MKPEADPTEDLSAAEVERLCRALDAAWEQLRRGAGPGPGEGLGPEDLKVLATLHEARRTVAEDSTADSTLDWKPEDSPTEDPAAGLALAPGSRLGDYVIKRFLSRGGMGEVYLAGHELMCREVVVKVLPADRQSADALRRFHTEIQALARLGVHPNLAAAFDAGEHEGRVFLVQEYIRGTDLKGHVQRVGPLGPAQACDCVRQAALGLDHAHRHGVIHRDIKPSNLMLTPEGAVKILDLGLAQAARESAGPDEGRTQAGTLLGTPDYMAPEQAEDPRRAEPRSDLYSLGCTFYFLLTGRPPFARPSTLSKLRAHALEPPPPVRQARPHVPEAVTSVLDRLLAKRPEDRYASARELITGLDAAGALATRPATAARRWWLSAVAAGLLLMVGVGLLLPHLLREKDPAAAPAEPGELQVTCHLEHYRPGESKEDLVPFVPIGEPGSHRAVQDDRVVLRAKFSEPVYPSVLAINPDGSTQLLLPDEAGPAKPLRDLRAPAQWNRFYTLDDAGFQGLVLLASRQPLPPFNHWRPKLDRQAWQGVRTRLPWGFDDRGVLPLRLEQRLGIAEHEPKVLADVCRSLQSRPGVAAVRAVAFPVQRGRNPPKGGLP